MSGFERPGMGSTSARKDLTLVCWPGAVTQNIFRKTDVNLIQKCLVGTKDAADTYIQLHYTSTGAASGKILWQLKYEQYEVGGVLSA